MKILIFKHPDYPEYEIKVFLESGSNKIFVVVTKA